MDALPPEALLSDVPGPMAEIGEWLRGVVQRAVPEAIERVRPGWRLIGYDIPNGPRRLAYFAYIAPEPIHVHLGFEHGTSMLDPGRLLQGAGITRQVRWVTLTPGSILPEHRLAELVREAARVALLSRAERAALAEHNQG
ncbi:MAG: DUF1801 domain-containing protein [Chloroflexota bacterium]|nr:MAG: DUF1801 domain-containing protein [Chloroflexota bacterium]